MRNWFSRHPIWFMAFYLVFYLSVFHWLEVNITVPEVWVHCHLDDLIPFCKYAVIPYLAWFIWIPFTLFYLLWKAPRADFWRLCLPLFAGMTIALAVYVILPNGLDLRPYRVYGSDIFARIVRQLYSTDTATNVCPSIHVFNSVTLMMAYYRSRIFEEPRRRWMRPASAVLCLSIIASTVCSNSTAASMWSWASCWPWQWTAPPPRWSGASPAFCRIPELHTAKKAPAPQVLFFAA